MCPLLVTNRCWQIYWDGRILGEVYTVPVTWQNHTVHWSAQFTNKPRVLTQRGFRKRAQGAKMTRAFALFFGDLGGKARALPARHYDLHDDNRSRSRCGCLAPALKPVAMHPLTRSNTKFKLQTAPLA